MQPLVAAVIFAVGLRPSGKASKRRRALPAVCLLRFDCLDIFLASTATRGKTASSVTPTLSLQLLSQVTSPPRPDPSWARRFHGYAGRAFGIDGDLSSPAHISPGRITGLSVLHDSDRNWGSPMVFRAQC